MVTQRFAVRGIVRFEKVFIHKKYGYNMGRNQIPQRIKNQVLVRQKGSCQDCGNNLKYIDFHHVDEDNTNSFDINNIVALCPVCHRSRHDKGNISENSFKEEKKERDSITNFKLPNFNLPQFEAPKFDLGNGDIKDLI